jgi:hypothetical protein
MTPSMEEPNAAPINLEEAWLQHAAAVESKLGSMARAFDGMIQELRTQGDPSRYPDPFALAALNAAVTLYQGEPVAETRDVRQHEYIVNEAAPAFEAWLRSTARTSD